MVPSVSLEAEASTSTFSFVVAAVKLAVGGTLAGAPVVPSE